MVASKTIDLQMLTILSIQTHSSALKILSYGFVLGLNNTVPVHLWDNIHLGLHWYIILTVTNTVLKVWAKVKVPSC